MPQFPSTFPLFSSIDCDSYFPDVLLYLCHNDTGTMFLADTGSVVNIIKMSVLSKYYPEADKIKIPYDVPLKGIGGQASITHFTFISFSKEVAVPFCTGLQIPINCIGLHWIEQALAAENIITHALNPRVFERGSHSRINASVLPDIDVSKGPKERKEAGRALNDPQAERASANGSRNSDTADPRATGGHNTPVAKGGLEYSKATGSFDDPRATVSQNNQEAGRALNDPQAERALNGSPNCMNTKTAQHGTIEQDSEVPLAFDPLSDGPMNQPEEETTLKSYMVSQNESDTDLLIQKLEQTRQRILQKPSEPPLRNMHDDDNTLIAKPLWESVYRPYSAVLEDLEHNLRMPSLLTYKCNVTLLNPLATPCVVSAYQIRSDEQRQALEDNIDKFLKLGVMEEGPSTWYTPLFVVPQKVNEEQKALDPKAQKWRVVQNFQPLNSQVVKEENTLPTIEDVLSLGEGNKHVFSNIDLKSAFYHVDIEEDARRFFGISHASRKIRMRKMGMGFTNSPSIWQRNMNVDVEKPVRDAYCATLSPQERSDPSACNVIKIYMDDILLATATVEQHLTLLQILFQQLSKLRLTLSIGKSFIGKREVNILGSTLSSNTRKVQPERVHALSLFAPPQTIFELRHFLGGIRYISDHVPLLNLLLRNFDSQVGGTPARLSRSTPFLWTWTLYHDFLRIHELIQNPEILFQIDSTLPLYLETDASELGFGAVLFQQKGEDILPIAYHAKKWQSPTMKGAQRNPSTTARRELKALQNSILHFNKILMNRPFHIITDNICVLHQVKNATRALSPKMPTDLVAHRSLEAILLYPIASITHKSSGEVFTSDGLSRMAWMELSPEENDRTAWPVMSIQKAGLPEEISRHLVRHFRHERCPHLNHGMHSYSLCVKPFIQRYTEISETLLNQLQSEERIIVTPEGWNAFAGHSDGIPPVYNLFNTPGVILTHWTEPRNVPLIKRNGLSPMSRRYIHFKDTKPLTRNRHYPLRVNTSSLISANRDIYYVQMPDASFIHLVPGHIQPESLIFD